MRGNYAEFLLVLGLLCMGNTLGSDLNVHNSEVRCKPDERKALLKFNQGLKYPLDSWKSEEGCCKWEAIECSEQTGHVVKLDLSHRAGFVAGNLEFIGSLTKLQYLNLSSFADFNGTIPHNLDWLPNLSSLRHLDLSGVNLSQAVNWPGKVDMLPSLLDLHLRDCGLSMPQISSSISRANFTSPLSTLDLSGNKLDSFVFPWLSKYINLHVLDLSFSSLEGVIPDLTQFPLLRELYLSHNQLTGSLSESIGKLSNLHVLDLSFNSLEGVIPELTQLSLLRELNLCNNQLNGSLTESIGKLSNLVVLDVSSNYLGGAITEAHFSNLSMLRQLDFSFNSLSLNLSTSWVPPFNLDTIRLSSCKVGPAFPRWLQTQRNFEWLDMSNAGISDTIPDWFWDLSPVINIVNLSRNEIQGTIPSQWLSSFVGNPQLAIDMSHNRFNGLLPSLHPNSTILVLSNNSFQGSITSICEKLQVSSDLNYLDLSHNSLLGEIPENCFSKVSKMSSLQVLNLANNKFTGRIPDSAGSLCPNLMVLQLQNNLFTGELPEQFMNCWKLEILDVGGNKLFGRIPEWIGMSLESLVVLRLPSNSYNGSIPVNLCDHLPSLQILDLSNNNITGTLPRCLNNFIRMITENETSSLKLEGTSYSYGTWGMATTENPLLMNYMANLFVMYKGKSQEFDKTLRLLKLMDLSNNNLEGEIPREITSLYSSCTL